MPAKHAVARATDVKAPRSHDSHRHWHVSCTKMAVHCSSLGKHWTVPCSHGAGVLATDVLLPGTATATSHIAMMPKPGCVSRWCMCCPGNEDGYTT